MQTTKKETQNQRKTKQIFATRVSLAGSIVLFLISAGIGIAVDSVTLLLDASANLVILVVAFLMHATIEKMHKPPDAAFNFGYGKYEPFTVVIQGALIIMTCFIGMKFAIQDIIHPEPVKNYYLPVIGTLICSIIGIFILVYMRKTAKKTNSTMLKTAGLHWLTDTVMSFGIFGGFCAALLLNRSGYAKITPYVDPVLAIILALFLIRSPIKVMAHNSLELLDAAPTGHISDKVKKTVERHKPEPFDIKRIRMRKAGENIFIDVRLGLKADLSMPEIARLCADFEDKLKNDLANCDIIIHFTT